MSKTETALAPKQRQEAPASSRQILSVLVDGLRLVSPADRGRLIWLLIASFPVALIDTVGLTAIVPFVQLLIDPNGIRDGSMTARLLALLGNPHPDRALLIVGGAGFILMVLGVTLSFAQQNATVRAAAMCQQRLAADLMTRIVSAPYVWFLGINSAHVAHVFHRDVLMWGRELILKSLNIVRDLVLILIPVIALVMVVPLIGFISIIAIGACSLLALALVKKRIVVGVAQKFEADGKANIFSVQTLSGAKDVKVSGREQFFVDAFSKSFNSYTDLHSRITILHQIPTKALLLTAQTGMFAVCFALWWSGMPRAELAGALAMFMLVITRLVPIAQRMSTSVSVLTAVAPAIQSITGILRDLQAAVAREPGEQSNVPVPRPWRTITLKDVSFSYPQGNGPALKHLNAKFEAGKAYAIVGVSGAGKSTLADIVLGLFSPSSGTVLIDQRPLYEFSLRNWQSRIGYVSQSPFILDDTFRANVAFGVPPSQVDSQRLARSITNAGLDDLLADLPNGLDTVLGDRGSRISGGQRQRIAIARALYDDVDLLILDEATSALDNITERAVQAAIDMLKGKITTITIAHRLSTVRHADSILVMERGTLVAQGNWDELLTVSPAFRSFVEASPQVEAA